MQRQRQSLTNSVVEVIEQPRDVVQSIRKVAKLVDRAKNLKKEFENERSLEWRVSNILKVATACIKLSGAGVKDTDAK